MPTDGVVLRSAAVLTLSVAASGVATWGCGGTTSPGQPVFVEAPAPEEAPPYNDPPGESANEAEALAACERDSDCVPATCCHPIACTTRVLTRDCREVTCTQDCQFGTLDCGGTCVCADGRCGARLSVAPVIATE